MQNSNLPLDIDLVDTGLKDEELNEEERLDLEQLTDMDWSPEDERD